ncbi:MAG: nucleoside triphosphate pyrophosphohydrolase family protein [Lachnospiraceae bacterium]|nr:nucleoside triphosphate pyrophosphohydrolase family protein [Lachnospiraceae bacterium]
MTGNEYQQLAMRTANKACRNLSNVGLGLSGEAGECSDMIKKHLHHGHDLDTDHLKKELGDVLWYVALGCDLIGCTLDEVMQLNIDKLKARYPEGFDTDKSLHRAEGDI